ncbi:hypothetical protein [Azohydromonas caseinilytica]|uniref:Uncharacterized protein n=1 Tax=Azohydromonas caseinilytica TaxID=2728836 RepID=A0A848FEA6_9BURK|nr:hypothetical protein [Azohydromonas caseinilytica]NML17738.1 hypothetical protein [Azohydromonas caseinilytica]
MKGMGLVALALLAGTAWAQDAGQDAQPAPTQPPAQAAQDGATPGPAQPAEASREAAKETRAAADTATDTPAEPASQEAAAEGSKEGTAPDAASAEAAPAPARRLGVSFDYDVEPQLLALWRPTSRPSAPLPVAPLLPPEESPLLPPAPFAAPSVWSTQAYRLLPDKPLAASRIYAPRPQRPLKDTAFTAPRDCPLDPFASPSTDDRVQQLRKDCGRDRLRLGVDGSRVELATVQPAALLGPAPASPQAPLKLEVDQLHSQQWSALSAPLITSLRLGWQGSREGRLGQVQSDQRALLATGGLLRLGPDAALDMSVGRLRSGTLKSGELRTRTSVTGLWRPMGEHMVYAQWAEEPTGVAREVGVRWWLQPGRLALDMGARRSAEGQPLEPRLSLSMSGFLR